MSEHEILGLINEVCLSVELTGREKPLCLISMMDQSNPCTSFAIPMPDIMPFAD